jgi:predicted DNA-binding transcriptional regulator YafY
MFSSELLKKGVVDTRVSSWEEDVFDEKLINTGEIRKIYRKIRKMLAEEEIKELDKKVLLRKYHPYLATINEKVYSVIDKAFNERRTIEIEYFSMEKGEMNRRKIDVYYKSSRYVIAFCHLRKAIRKFRTPRIVNAKLINEKYAIP